MRFIGTLIFLLVPQLAIAAGWQAVLDRDGVHVEVREVPGSRVQEIRGQAVVGASPEVLFAILRDARAYADIVPHNESVTLLRTTGDEAVYHMVIHPPWLSRRDYCVRSTPITLGNGTYLARWSLATDSCPAPGRSVVRIQRNEGFWMLSPTQAGKATQVTYQGITDPGGQVPAWIVNRASPRELPTIFRGLRRAAEHPRYAALQK